MQQLFPKVALAAKRFLAEKLDRKGDSQPCDVLLVGEYMQAAFGSLLEAIKKGSSTAESEVAVVPQGAAGRGSNAIRGLPHDQADLSGHAVPSECYGRGYPEMGTERGVPPRQPHQREELGEERPARLLHPLPQSRPTCSVRPDFLVATNSEQKLIVEVKGQVTDSADAKSKAAQRWVDAVNRLGQHGTWHYLLVTDPGGLGQMLNAFVGASWSEGEFALS